MCDVVFKALRVLLGSNDCRQHCKIGSFHLLTLKEKQHIRCLWVATPNRLFFSSQLFRFYVGHCLKSNDAKESSISLKMKHIFQKKIADIDTIVCCLWGFFLSLLSNNSSHPQIYHVMLWKEFDPEAGNYQLTQEATISPWPVQQENVIQQCNGIKADFIYSISYW